MSEPPATSRTRPGPGFGEVGLWGGFLDRLPTQEALACVQRLERAGVGTVWLQEHSGVDPFVRAALYLSATDHLTVGIGVAVIHARDPEAMVALGATLAEAFPGRVVLGLGVSHRSVVEGRGHRYTPPVATMENYLSEMRARAGRRTLPPLVLGALGPAMTALAARAADGAHTYLAPVAHTAATRAAMGEAQWLAPTQFVAPAGAEGDWRAGARQFIGWCAAMPNYAHSLRRMGFDDAAVADGSDAVVDALVAPDGAALGGRIAEHLAAGADHVVVQVVPPPRADAVVALVEDGLLPR